MNKSRAVYAIIENDPLDKAIFRRVGTAFENRDGSVNILLDAVPLAGRLQIRDVPQEGRGAGR